MMTESLLTKTLKNARARLLSERNAQGFWEGELSSSALATAVAVFALAHVDCERHHEPIRKGLAWLAANVNSDGGYGDSEDSLSNMSTSLLCWSVFSLEEAQPYHDTIKRLEKWIEEKAGSLDADDLSRAVLAYYGNDRTFSAPILTMCALGGRLGLVQEAWRRVPQLPFELAIMPHRVFKWLRLPVVSYAIPALIGIGLVRHHHRPTPGWGRVRNALQPYCLRVLEKIQPDNGGFLEATPLTAFVTMSLAMSGMGDHLVVRRAVQFLLTSMRPDGGWPIDTNLSTWVTTLSVNALNMGDGKSIDFDLTRAWLLAQQYHEQHPYTHADPGGWAWTDLPGGVPDADDTSGALLALRNMGEPNDETCQSAEAGIGWLLGLQNSDGGIPTFCRGWGKLPFDRSCPDLTAHALRAFDVWRDDLSPETHSKIDTATLRALDCLEHNQRNDGAWVPLWFGNQKTERQENPVYGTAVVLIALQDIAERHGERIAGMVERGSGYLERAQRHCGGWGGAIGCKPSVEETALATAAQAACGKQQSADRGAIRLAEMTEAGTKFPSAPIGLYFASLWYYEKIYPIVFTVAALERLSLAETKK